MSDEEDGMFKILLVLLHGVLMNFLFLLPLILVITPIVGVGILGLEFWRTEPIFAALGGLVSLGAVASVLRVWLRLMVS